MFINIKNFGNDLNSAIIGFIKSKNLPRGNYKLTDFDNFLNNFNPAFSLTPAMASDFIARVESIVDVEDRLINHESLIIIHDDTNPISFLELVSFEDNHFLIVSSSLIKSCVVNIPNEIKEEKRLIQ